MLQKQFTAILKAAYKGHLSVLQTLVEQYGGNVLHSNKVNLLAAIINLKFNCTSHSRISSGMFSNFPNDTKMVYASLYMV